MLVGILMLGVCISIFFVIKEVFIVFIINYLEEINGVFVLKSNIFIGVIDVELIFVVEYLVDMFFGVIGYDFKVKEGEGIIIFVLGDV